VKKTTMCVAVALLAAVAIGAARDVSPLGLIPEPTPPPGLQVNVWTDKAQYTVGEYARVFVHITQPAYVYVLSIDSVGQVRQIFPNWFSPNPYLPAGTHVLPDKPTYRLRVAAPAGIDHIQVFASRQPLMFQPGSEAQPFPLIAPDPEQGRVEVLGLIPEPVGYVTAWHSFRIVQQPAPPPAPPAPCPPGWWWGPCPPSWSPPSVPAWGWGWYYHDGSWHVYIGECPSFARLCWYLGPDGRWKMSFRISIGN